MQRRDKRLICMISQYKQIFECAKEPKKRKEKSDRRWGFNKFKYKDQSNWLADSLRSFLRMYQVWRRKTMKLLVNKK